MSNSVLKLAFVALVTISATYAGKCPEIEPIQDFNLTGFLGTWHEIERFPNRYEYFTSCVVSDYKVTGTDDAGTTMKIDMDFVRFYKSSSGSLDTLYRKGDTKGEFIIMPEYETEPNAFILATDYKTYALQYSCEESFLWGTVEMASILSRSQEISADITAKLKQIIDDMGSDSSKFEEPEHQNCPGTPGYPESRPFKWVNFS